MAAAARFDDEIDRLARLPENAGRVRAYLAEINEDYDFRRTRRPRVMPSASPRRCSRRSCHPPRPRPPRRGALRRRASAAKPSTGLATSAPRSRPKQRRPSSAKVSIRSSPRSGAAGSTRSARGAPNNLRRAWRARCSRRLPNIRKVRSGLDRGKYSVWKLDRIAHAPNLGPPPCVLRLLAGPGSRQRSSRFTTTRSGSPSR